MDQIKGIFIMLIIAGVLGCIISAFENPQSTQESQRYQIERDLKEIERLQKDRHAYEKQQEYNKYITGQKSKIFE
jgi:hypothetical protein